MRENKTELESLVHCFNRFKGVSTQSNKTINDRPNKFLRVGVSDYWLDWTEVARRASFDFDYLSSLQPIEMRFYELTQLLRFRSSSEPVDSSESAALVMRYSEFAKLMPLPRLKTYDQVERQINKLSFVHLKSGYLKSLIIKPINRKGMFTDAILELSFTNK